MPPQLFDFQQSLVNWAVLKGRAAIFADCGLGKTAMQLEWARLVQLHTSGKILILTPLAVAEQTIAMALSMMGMKVTFAMTGDICKEPGIYITNYEKLHHFDAGEFSGVILDESSILKNYVGKTRTAIIDQFVDTPYRLACTATPAPVKCSPPICTRATG
jgi:superfamily II DNA or RNA helicase